MKGKTLLLVGILAGLAFGVVGSVLTYKAI